MIQKGIVYLIPSLLDENGIEAIPSYIITVVKDCRVFFVENERTARRYLKKLWKASLSKLEVNWRSLKLTRESCAMAFWLMRYTNRITMVSDLFMTMPKASAI